MRIGVHGFGLVAVTALLAACGGGAQEAPPEQQTSAPAAPAAAATQAEAPPADSTDTIDGTTLADFTPDAEHGATVFLQCGTCHVRDEGVNRIGPSLANVVGRKASSISDFQYSDANHASGITWTPEKLFQYLENPQRVVPGTKMAFAGLPNGQDRADVIAYLQDSPRIIWVKSYARSPAHSRAGPGVLPA